ncbi:MAG: endonuclease/exonuclease/phosphatase family protein [Deltaproteobacteria bacterium]
MSWPSDGMGFCAMTYNVRHAEWSSIASIAGVVSSARPELVAIQELDRGSRRSGRDDQPAALARALGLEVRFAKTTEFEGGDYGHALFSRWPIVGHEEVPLPSAEEPRVLLLAEVSAPGGTLRVGAVHLGLDAGIRRRQVEALAERLEGEPRTLLLGDLNESPSGEVHRRLSASFRDCFLEAGDGDGFTYPAPTPSSRIDYVFRSQDLPTARSADVLKARSSDHFPVLARF